MSNQPPEFYDSNPQGNAQQWNPQPAANPSQPQPAPWEGPQAQYDQPFYGNSAPQGQPDPYQQMPDPCQQGPYAQQGSPYAQQGSPYPQQDAYQGSFYAQNPYGPGSYPFPGSADPRPRPSVGFVAAIKLFFKNYAVFSGRASRSEYWWVQLFLTAVYFVWTILFSIAGGFAALAAEADPYGTSMASTGVGAGVVLLMVLAGFMYLAIIVPSLAIAWRRFHDTDKSGAFYFLNFIPWVGGIVVLILLAMPSVPTAWQRWDNGVLPADS